jgi:type I restriction enzyme S subunit
MKMQTETNRSNKMGLSKPQLRFKSFSNNWNKVCLGRVLSFYSTNSLSRNALSTSGGGPRIVHYGDIHMKLPTLVRTYDNLIPAAIELTIRGENLKRGDLLIADASEDRMDIGKAIEVIDTDDRLTFGGLHVIHARPNSGLFHPGFAGQLMQSKRCRLEFMRRANGASVLGLSSKQISQIELMVPGREEQEKIAGFLGVVDARFGLLKRKKELLETYKKGVMQKLFSREIRFKDEEGRGYPEWEEKRLGDVSYKSTRKNSETLDLDVLTNSASRGVVRQSQYFEREITTESNLNGYYIVPSGYFVYNPRISNAAPAGPINRNNGDEGLMSPLYTVFEVEAYCSDFLSKYFDSRHWHRYLKAVSNYGVRHDRMNVTNEDFFAMPIALPIQEEMDKLVNFLNDLERSMKMTNKMIQRLDRFKVGLLQKMFV